MPKYARIPRRLYRVSDDGKTMRPVRVIWTLYHLGEPLISNPYLCALFKRSEEMSGEALPWEKQAVGHWMTPDGDWELIRTPIYYRAPEDA